MSLSFGRLGRSPTIRRCSMLASLPAALTCITSDNGVGRAPCPSTEVSGTSTSTLTILATCAWERASSAVIVPGVEHRIEPSTDARFYRPVLPRAWLPRWSPDRWWSIQPPPIRSMGTPRRSISILLPEDLRDGDTPVLRRRPGRAPSAVLQFRPRVSSTGRRTSASVTDLLVPRHSVRARLPHRHDRESPAGCTKVTPFNAGDVRPLAADLPRHRR